jgi:hypothetical protein
MAAFPTTTEFNTTIEKEDVKAISWGKLVENTIYRIDSWKSAKTRLGDAMILTMATEGGETVVVWATPMIVERMRIGKKNEVVPQRCFIRPTGKKVCKSDLTRSYHSFDFMEST